MQSPVVKGRDLRTVRGAARTVRLRAAAINADCRRPGAGGPQGASEVHHLDRGERGAHRAVRPGRPVVVDRQIDVYATNVVVVPLVVPALEPSWAVVFPRVGAVVAEIGGELSHAAILLREAAKPAIVNCQGIYGTISEGDTLRLDGASGVVSKIVETNTVVTPSHS